MAETMTRQEFDSILFRFSEADTEVAALLGNGYVLGSSLMLDRAFAARDKIADELWGARVPHQEERIPPPGAPDHTEDVR